MKKRVLYPLLTMIFLSPLIGGDYRGYTIAQVNYHLEGSTRISALNAFLQWEYDRVFTEKWELESYLREEKQILINKRVFKSVILDYRVTGEAGGVAQVEIDLRLTEAWNIYPIPIYTYDSNFGLTTGLGTTYYNFLGTLTDLGVKGYYSPGKSELTGTLSGLRLGPFHLDLALSQFWEEVKSIDEKEAINLRYRYARTVFKAGFLIQLIDNLDYIASPTLLYPFNYDFEINRTDKEDDFYTISGLTPSFSHMIRYKNVNWIGNLRQGYSLSIENGVDYQSGGKVYTVWVDGILTTYIYMPMLNYNSRVSSFFYHNGYRENAGDRMRGILDFKMTGTWGFFWNQNFVVPVVEIPGIADLHLTPFIDTGFVGDSNQIFKRNEVLHTLGISLALFPAALPNVQISIDYGVNMDDTAEREVLIRSILFF